MKKLLTKKELIAFEEEIADCFNKAMIKAPVHLYNGNENNMLSVFKHINKNDWVLCSWRNHYQCLLKGVPKKQLKTDILAGRSISLCYKKYKIISSGIVAGVLPIAVGIALDIKNKNKSNKVFCFMGDMTSETGVAHECIKYCINKKLPIHFIIEDNSKSVCTITREVWGLNKLTYEDIVNKYITFYKYDGSKYPHAGSGKRIQF
ncbi:MAG: thiamine pyrophosphate-dependent enzyme [Candidatus Zambryskibacteria bacterium]|nr:thiamine pyrophosphate-dependent enzyme [Candidatus Zambryskibacteria bacterium]